MFLQINWLCVIFRSCLMKPFINDMVVHLKPHSSKWNSWITLILVDILHSVKCLHLILSWTIVAYCIARVMLFPLSWTISRSVSGLFPWCLRYTRIQFISSIHPLILSIHVSSSSILSSNNPFLILLLRRHK